jgi:hypothetical protein
VVEIEPMALFTESGLRSLAAQYRGTRVLKSADTILREAATTTETNFDVFLSHSVKDADVVLGIVAALKQQNLKVYVDWIVDPHMDRSRVSSETAERLRQRMRQSAALIYAHSNQSGSSKWMPWELGYFDGFRSAVSILPIAQTTQESFAGQEYLGLYPYVDGSGTTLWVNRGSAPERLFRGPIGYKQFPEWLREQTAR